VFCYRQYGRHDLNLYDWRLCAKSRAALGYDWIRAINDEFA